MTSTNCKEFIKSKEFKIENKGFEINNSKIHRDSKCSIS